MDSKKVLAVTISLLMLVSLSASYPGENVVSAVATTGDQVFDTVSSFISGEETSTEEETDGELTVNKGGTLTISAENIQGLDTESWEVEEAEDDKTSPISLVSPRSGESDVGIRTLDYESGEHDLPGFESEGEWSLLVSHQYEYLRANVVSIEKDGGTTEIEIDTSSAEGNWEDANDCEDIHNSRNKEEKCSLPYGGYQVEGLSTEYLWEDRYVLFRIDGSFAVEQSGSGGGGGGISNDELKWLAVRENLDTYNEPEDIAALAGIPRNYVSMFGINPEVTPYEDWVYEVRKRASDEGWNDDAVQAIRALNKADEVDESNPNNVGGVNIVVTPNGFVVDEGTPHEGCYSSPPPSYENVPTTSERFETEGDTCPSWLSSTTKNWRDLVPSREKLTDPSTYCGSSSDPDYRDCVTRKIIPVCEGPGAGSLCTELRENACEGTAGGGSWTGQGCEGIEPGEGGGEQDPETGAGEVNSDWYWINWCAGQGYENTWPEPDTSRDDMSGQNNLGSCGVNEISGCLESGPGNCEEGTEEVAKSYCKWTTETPNHETSGQCQDLLNVEEETGDEDGTTAEPQGGMERLIRRIQSTVSSGP